MCACTDMDDWGNWNDNTKPTPPPARRMPSRQASSVRTDSAPDPAMSTSQPNATDDWEALLNAGQHHVQHATPKLPIASRPAPSTAFMQSATGAGKLQRKAPGAPAAPNQPAATNTAAVQTVQKPYPSQPLLSKSATTSENKAVNQIGSATKPAMLGRTGPAKPALGAQRFSKLPPGEKTLGIKPKSAIATSSAAGFSPSPPAAVSAALQLSTEDTSSDPVQRMRTSQAKLIPPAEKPEAHASGIRHQLAKPVASKVQPTEQTAGSATSTEPSAELSQGGRSTPVQRLPSFSSSGKGFTAASGPLTKPSLAAAAAITDGTTYSCGASTKSQQHSPAPGLPLPSAPLPHTAATPFAFSRSEMSNSQRRMRLGLSAKPPAAASSQATPTQAPSTLAPSAPTPSSQPPSAQAPAAQAHSFQALSAQANSAQAPSTQTPPSQAPTPQAPSAQPAGKLSPAIPTRSKPAAAETSLPTAGHSAPSGVTMTPKVLGLTAKLPLTSASAQHTSAFPLDSPASSAAQLEARQAVLPAACPTATGPQPKPVKKAEEQVEAVSSADTSASGTHVSEPIQPGTLAKSASEVVAKSEAALALPSEASALQTLAQGSKQPTEVPSPQPARSLLMPAQAPRQKAVPSLPQKGRPTQASAPAQTPTAAPSLPQTARQPSAASQAQAAATPRPAAASKQAAPLSAPTAPMLKPSLSHALPAVADTSTADRIAEGWSITLSPVMCPDNAGSIIERISSSWLWLNCRELGHSLPSAKGCNRGIAKFGHREQGTKHTLCCTQLCIG